MIKKILFIILGVLMVFSFSCSLTPESNFQENKDANVIEENAAQDNGVMEDSGDAIKENEEIEEEKTENNKEGETYAGDNPPSGQEQEESAGIPPEISLKIIEGPLYAQDGNVCYYRVKAEAGGNPSPKIIFSKDDSKGAWGENIAQINLREGESYKLEARAVNQAGEADSFLLLEWKEQEIPQEKEEIDYTDSSNFKIDVILEEQLVRVYYKGDIIREMICSGGTEDDPTPTGTFKTNEKIYYSWLPKYEVGAYYFVRFYGAYLFHSVPYDEDGNIIEEERNKLGSPASHGCIRLSVEDAEWFYQSLPLGIEVNIY